MVRKRGDVARVRELLELIRFHNDNYYNKDAPQISDVQYDTLFSELQELEAKRHDELRKAASPTQIVGGNPSSVFCKVRHAVPMLSLEKARTTGEMTRFFKRLGDGSGKGRWVAMPKLDGLAATLVYTASELKYGATRGDGKIGEDVTANLSKVKGVPLRLPAQWPSDLELRGEVIMTDTAFAKLNEAQRQRELKEFVNPRNAAAGALRQLQADKSRLASLDFFSYWALGKNGDIWPTATITLKMLSEKVQVAEPWQPLTGIKDFSAYLEEFQHKRQNLGFAVDGIVVRVDDNSTAYAMGANARAPRGAIAYKFAAIEAYTKVRSIDYQVGRSGVVTPVAKLDPVKVGGVTVSSVTLHNCRMLTELDLHMDDKIAVIRSGDVIPKVTEVLREARKPNAQRFQVPEDCPVCKSKLQSSLVNKICVSPSCSGKLLTRISHFVSRDAMDIEGLGAERLEALIRKGIIARSSDVFNLQAKQLASLKRMADKSAANVVAALDKARATTLAKVLYALGIPGLGKTGAAALATAFGSVGNLEGAKPETICFVKPVQLAIARKVVKHLEGKAGGELRRLRQYNVSWDEQDPKGMVATIVDVLVHIAYLAGMENDMLLFAPGWPKLSQAMLTVLQQADKAPVTIDDLANLNEAGYAALGATPQVAKAGMVTIGELLEHERFQIVITDLRERLSLRWGRASSKGGVLAGQTVVVTGSLAGMTRKEVQELIRSNGGKPSSAVTSKTSVIVIGEKAGKSKLAKAIVLEIKTVMAKEFLASLNQAGI